MGEGTMFTVTDRTGETRTVRKGEFITVERGRETFGFHLHGIETRNAGGIVYLRGDEMLLDAAFCRFAAPDAHPAPGRLRLTFKRSGAWAETDSRDYRLTSDGFDRVGHHQHIPMDDVTVEGSPAAVIPPVRTFGRLEEDDWLAVKQREESEELLYAAREWLYDPTDGNRRVMLDELADLLQTVANLCAAYRIGADELEAALDRCWGKNMRREQPAAGSAEAMLVRFGIRPNGKVRDRETGRTLTVLPSDTWGRRLDTAKVGVYGTDWRHPEWLRFTRLEPVEDGEEGL